MAKKRARRRVGKRRVVRRKRKSVKKRKGHVPLHILKKRLKKLSRIVKSRS